MSGDEYRIGHAYLATSADAEEVPSGKSIPVSLKVQSVLRLSWWRDW
jgi:hypothetical protein